MTKKQRKMLVRIILAAILFLGLSVCGHMGIFDIIEYKWILFIIYLIPYFLVGYDIILKAARNISHGQVFDENFLMMIATFGAFGVGEYSEAVEVVLFYQVGELFHSYAVGICGRAISDTMDICAEFANMAEEGKLL